MMRNHRSRSAKCAGNAHLHNTPESRTLPRTLPAQTSLKALAGAVLARSTARTMIAQYEEKSLALPAHSDEVTAHYPAAAWAEFEALLKRVAPYYQTPEHEYIEIREAAAKDIEAALQSYRAMAEEFAEPKHRALGEAKLPPMNQGNQGRSLP